MFGEEGAELKLEDIQVTDFGEVGELSVSKDDCLMLYGKGILSYYTLYGIISSTNYTLYGILSCLIIPYMV